MLKQPLLSISLLSSGRADSIERCLSSLNPIRDAIPTEIIIVDTDSAANEPIRGLLEKYADEIVPFEWCDDFSAARNAGLSKCSGKWFMFIDDDEWLLDATPLISFFKSGDYKKYSDADIIIRNYLTEDFEKYNDGWVSRLVRLDKGVKFTGRVHEYIDSKPSDIAAIDALLGHSGYIFYTDEDRLAHAKRNIPLLERSVEEEPENIHWYYQLYLEYDSVENRGKQYRICEDALALLAKRHDGQADAFYGFFVTALLRLYRIEGNRRQLADSYKKYYNRNRFGVTPQAYINMEMALCSYEQAEFREASEFAKSYLKAWKKWHTKTDELRNEALFFLSGTFGESIYSTVISILNAADIRSGSWASFEKYFHTLKFVDSLPYDFYGTVYRYAKLMAEVPYNSHFVDMARAFSYSDIAKSALKQSLDEASAEGQTNIIRAIEELDASENSEKNTKGNEQMSEHIDLSISLLSSGRSDTIERCLASMAPFKEQLNTEIVVVDTDPDHKEDVHAILEKYADKIIPFEWCDDFSAARNAGLFACKGDWYLYVDDDEWWIDAQPAIDFLKSKEKDKYYWTNTMTRNYTSKDWSTYTDAWATRLVRRTENLKFCGVVHEYLDPLPGKLKVVNAIEGHTGYLYKDDKAKEEHSRRNVSLLEKQIKAEPDEPRWRLQLLQEYADTDDIEKQRQIAKDGLKMVKTFDGEGYDRSRGLFAGYLILLERQAKNWEGAIRAYNLALKEKRYNDVAKAYMELDAAQAYFYTDDYRESTIHCHNYLRYYNKLHNKLDSINEDLMFYMSTTFDDHMWALAACLLMYIEMQEGKFDAFDKYFDKAKWTEDSEYDFRGYEDKFLEVLEESEYDPRFSHMVETFWKDPTARGMVQDHLQKLSGKGGEKYWRLVRALMEADLCEPIPWDLKILWADHNNDESADFHDMYEKLFSKINPLMLGDKIWELAKKRQIDIAGLIEALPFGGWRKGVEFFGENMPPITQAKLLAIISGFAPSAHRTYFMMKVMPYIIAAKAPELRESVSEDAPKNGIIEKVDTPEMGAYNELESLLKTFKNECIVFYSNLYKSDIMEEDSPLMEDDCRLALRLDDIFKAVEAEDYKGALAKVKDAMGIFTRLDDALSTYSRLYGAVVKKKIGSPEAEMKQLIDSLYAKVDELVSNGFVNEARDIIAQIEAIAPPELRRG